MNNSELDTLLSMPLPERDAGEFSVAMLECIARHEGRPARILARITTGVLLVVIVAACTFGASVAQRGSFAAPTMTVPVALAFLMLLLSFGVLQSTRE